MVGFDVTPRMPCTSISFCSPPVAIARVRLSYHGLCPNSMSNGIALAISDSSRSYRIEQRERALDSVLGCDAELLHDDVARRRHAEPVDADHVVGVTLPPEPDAGFDRERRDTGGQHVDAVLAVLLLEEVPRRHG